MIPAGRRAFFGYKKSGNELRSRFRLSKKSVYRKHKKARNNCRYFKRIKNAAENIEFSAALLSFPQNKLPPVRRRICFAKISLPFSTSASVPINLSARCGAGFLE